MTKFITRDREAGNIIDEFETRQEAIDAIEKYEAQDSAEGTYTPNFYEWAEVAYQLPKVALIAPEAMLKAARTELVAAGFQDDTDWNERYWDTFGKHLVTHHLIINPLNKVSFSTLSGHTTQRIVVTKLTYGIIVTSLVKSRLSRQAKSYYGSENFKPKTTFN